MKIKVIIVLTAFLLLCGCSRMGGAAIDWVDFVRLNGHYYTGLWEGVLKNPGDVTDEVVGEVKFKVADVVTNPHYRIKNGDAAFLPKGTKLYRVKGYGDKELIAAKDEKRIGGYRLFAEDSFKEKLPRHYKDVPKDKVERIELYHAGELKPNKTLYNDEKQRFIELLESGQDSPDYISKNEAGDPFDYHMVFYTDAPIANVYNLTDDGEIILFYPWDTRLVSEDIRELIRE